MNATVYCIIVENVSNGHASNPFLHEFCPLALVDVERPPKPNCRIVEFTRLNRNIDDEPAVSLLDVDIDVPVPWVRE